jgi:shikimate dehydrogenase
MPHLTGVLGWPVSHSISPPMHNAAFRALGLDWLYLPFAVQPADLPAAVGGLRALGFAGVNVTIPHKVAMLALMDEISPEAIAVGAVNTVIMRDGRMIGHNTDAYGYLTALTSSGYAPAGQAALVLGAGGAARSIVYALARAGAHVTICNRTAERASKLVTDLAPYLPGTDLRTIPATTQALASTLKEARLLVNTTSVGMTGGPPGSPLPDGLTLHPDLTVFDLVYAPPLTPLLRQARAAGAHTVGGLGMLVHQGAQALTLWTGYDAPVVVMERAARRALAQRERRS